MDNETGKPRARQNQRRAVWPTIIVACPQCGAPVKQFPRSPGRPQVYCSARCRNLAGVHRYRARKAGTPPAHTGGSTPTEGERT